MEPSFKSDLNEYLSQCKVRLESVLRGLNWTEAATLKDYNANSIASSSRRNLKKPCSTFKATFPNSCITENSVVLETQKLQGLLENNALKAPENFTELQANFSREQKLKLYQHAIDNTSKLDNALLDKDDEGEISLADILAQKKREEKSKKRRFRKSKPTHIEEVRCLVDLQMQALEQFLGNKIKNVKELCSKQDDYGKEIKYSQERLPKEYEGRERYRKMEEPSLQRAHYRKEIEYPKERRPVKGYDGRKRYREKEEACLQRTCSKDYGKEIKYPGERRTLKDYDRKERHRDIYTEYDDIKSCHKSFRNEELHNEHNSNRELDSCKTKRQFVSRGRETRERNISSEEDIRQERKKHKSKKKHKLKEKRKRGERSRSSSRRGRSYDKKNSEGRNNGRSRSYEREENSADQKYSSRSQFASCSEHSREKYNKYSTNQISIPESYRRRNKTKRND